MLTTADKPTVGTGVCASSEGAPCMPCILNSTKWQVGSDNVFVAGKPALLSKSKIICARGGIITLNKQNSHIYDGFSDSGELCLDQTKSKDGANIANSVGAEAVFPDKDNGLREEPEFSGSTAEQCRSCCWCSGKCPAKYVKHCAFRESSEEQILKRSDSEKLSKNLKNAFPDLYSQAEKILSDLRFEMKDSCRIEISFAHHHLIPGNECYGKRRKNGKMLYPLLVKLGNLFGYDINCAENGILLPSFANSQLSQIEQHEKPELFYCIMDKDVAKFHQSDYVGKPKQSIIGSQLHVGQHRYEKRLNLLRREHPELKKYRCYEDVVSEYLDTFETYYYDRCETVCYMRDYEQEKKNYFLRMNSISDALRQKVLSFPHHGMRLSWLDRRALVSFPALLYDVGIAVEEYLERYMGE